MGDLKAKNGSDYRGYEEIIGQHGFGVMKDRSERFADLCALDILVIGGCVVQHKRIHKATWVSPDLSTKNQTDRVCTGRKFIRSLQDVSMKCEADVASDHTLFTGKLKLKLKRNWTGNRSQRQRYDTTMLLRDTTKQQEFKIVLLNTFQVLEEPLEAQSGRQ